MSISLLIPQVQRQQHPSMKGGRRHSCIVKLSSDDFRRLDNRTSVEPELHWGTGGAIFVLQSSSLVLSCDEINKDDAD